MMGVWQKGDLAALGWKMGLSSWLAVMDELFPSWAQHGQPCSRDFVVIRTAVQCLAA
jgi:hypothetical protein